MDAFIQDIVTHYTEFTRGDLQAVVEAYSDTNGYSSDEILNIIDDIIDNEIELK